MFPENKIFSGAVRHVISLSGGKDSLALWLLSREWDIVSVVIFADAGHEHPLTYEYISLLEQNYPRGIPFLDLCIWKGRFTTSRARFCTFEL
ncbi:PUA domain (predicted RNA-binding domain) [Klebsiella michiganensis]|nr:PUA domain (predicted RNA-binding domain) [Klebsiella michiganensis]